MTDISKGAAGEVIAARFLREKGYRIIASNYRSRFGEIDIIAADKKYIVFVEVKTRSESAAYAPRETVTAAKQSKIAKTALHYLQCNSHDLQPRFDVIEILTERNNPMKTVELDHIRNAFETEGMHFSI
ncbi:MAG: YraN family protein [Oscillospiraceae bacterium]|nr:YraN family protein [Oscillospiraceae bacterium]